MVIRWKSQTCLCELHSATGTEHNGIAWVEVITLQGAICWTICLIGFGSHRATQCRLSEGFTPVAVALVAANCPALCMVPTCD